MPLFSTLRSQGSPPQWSEGSPPLLSHRCHLGAHGLQHRPQVVLAPWLALGVGGGDAGDIGHVASAERDAEWHFDAAMLGRPWLLMLMHARHVRACVEDRPSWAASSRIDGACREFVRHGPLPTAYKGRPRRREPSLPWRWLDHPMLLAALRLGSRLGTSVAACFGDPGCRGEVARSQHVGEGVQLLGQRAACRGGLPPLIESWMRMLSTPRLGAWPSLGGFDRAWRRFLRLRVGSAGHEVVPAKSGGANLL